MRQGIFILRKNAEENMYSLLYSEPLLCTSKTWTSWWVSTRAIRLKLTKKVAEVKLKYYSTLYCALDIRTYTELCLLLAEIFNIFRHYNLFVHCIQPLLIFTVVW